MSQVDTNTSWEFLLDEYFFVKYLRPQTEWSYRKVVNVFRKYYGMERKPCEITRRDVQQWRRHVINVEGSAAITWNNKVAHMRALMNFAMKASLIPQTENPFNDVLVRADNKRKKTLSRPQLTRVYLLMQQYADLDHQLSIAEMKRCALHPAWFWIAVLDTLRYTGMRVNQLMHVRLMDVNLEENWIELRLDGSKTHREWRVPIVSPLKPQLQHLVSRAVENGAESGDAIFDVNRFLWTAFERENLPPVATLQPVKSFFRRLSKECGFAVSPHRFRHTLATELMKSPDRNLQMVKGLLGHRSVTTTMEYIDINLEVTGRTLESELGLYTDKML
ncbi:tyrosine-type recombinase/integrase [Klebsiella michiganensis]|uniref:tyrosine-type recombinase/integrase n=1 Tax=Klebsiella michiganensis TaxID=1134687 RepID=UPI0015EAECD1|nr:site-specific integrase [Klebsiella michiganensis]QMR55609.1 site-specific integrase [Klebsiella michiganensis]